MNQENRAVQACLDAAFEYARITRLAMKPGLLCPDMDAIVVAQRKLVADLRDAVTSVAP